MKDELSILTYGAAKAAGGGGGTGDGDMKKAVYDSNDDGVVDAADNAAKVGGHTVATDVPANAVFTDTVYDDTSITNRVSGIEEVIPEGATSSNQLATQSDLPSAVIGNPEESATAGNLTKLQIGSDIFDVPSGGGGSSDPYDGRKTRYTISSSNWSSSPNSDGYYTYSLTLTNPLTTNTSPNVYIAGSTDSTQPTATESTMFRYVKRCNLSSSTTLVLYASTKPTSTFYVFVGAEGGSVGYSTSEQDTGLTWIDGKTIYRKVIDLGSMPDTSSKTVSLGISGKIDNLVRFDVFGKIIISTTTGYAIPIPFMALTATGNVRALVDIGNSSISIETDNDRSSWSAYAIIEYTKS